MNALEFYIITLATYAALNGIQALGLNIQFGLGGIFNFAYIVLVAVGAYATGIATMPPAPGGLTNYIGGFGWIFPWNVLFGVAATTAFGLLLSLVCFSRISHWYLALTLSSIGNALLVLITNDRLLFNGIIGLSGIPGPGQATLSQTGFQLWFLAIALVALALVYGIFSLIERSPLGRAIRALRDDDQAAMSLGKNPLRLKMVAFLLGSAAAGLGGGLMGLYFGSWNPSAWLPGETFVLLAAIIVGGRGWGRGALVGSIIVLEGLNQGSQFLPVVGNRPDLAPAIQAVVVSLLLMGVLWWRPHGLLPAPKERFPKPEADVRLGPPATARPLPGQPAPARGDL